MYKNTYTHELKVVHKSSDHTTLPQYNMYILGRWLLLGRMWQISAAHTLHSVVLQLVCMVSMRLQTAMSIEEMGG